MSAGIDVNISFRGGAEAAAALRRLPDEIQGKVLKSALRSAAKTVRDAMEAKLASVIGVPMEGPPRIGIFSAKPQEPGSTAAVAVGLYSEHFYHSFREFGTKHQAARPWMRPTIDEEGPKTVPPFGVEVFKALVRVAKRITKGRI